MKLCYDDIKLNGQVSLPDGYKHLEPATITGIENFAWLAGINEPIFSVKAKEDVRFNFGLKYILKNYIQKQ